MLEFTYYGAIMKGLHLAPQPTFPDSWGIGRWVTGKAKPRERATLIKKTKSTSLNHPVPPSAVVIMAG